MKQIILIIISFALCSCSSMHYGNLANTSISKDEYLAHDAAKKIAKIKVPARTIFNIYQKTNSVFGHKLIEILRQNGYGVQENIKSDKNSNFHYVIDQIDGSKRIRVSLYINSENLSRAYGTYNERLMPIGAWSHKE